MSDREATVEQKNNYGSIVATDEAQTGYQNETQYFDTRSQNSVQPDVPDEEMRSLNVFEKVGYGLGHIYNDLCAGVWFSYLLLFMQNVMKVAAGEAGILMMAGQVGDAIVTPVIGILTDRFGTKRIWHTAGTILVLFSFPLLFSICPWCTVLPHWWQTLYFCAIILLFQLGWAIVQITHLAMIPELSRSQTDRSDMTAIRYSGSIISSLIVYLVTWLILRGRTAEDNNIGPGDAPRFREISLILSVIGVSTTVVFQFALMLSKYEIRRRLIPRYERNQFDATVSVVDPEESGTSSSSAFSGDSIDEKTGLLPKKPQVVVREFNNWKFFKSPALYQNAFLYVFSRLFMTTALIYMPLWLDERAYIPPNGSTSGAGVKTNSIEHLATVPLASFVASFVSSVLIKYCNRVTGHQMAYFCGSLVGIAACFSVYYVSPASGSVFELYAIAVLFGAGSSVTMISSLSITADMIGSRAEKGGFIYSMVTFFDKLITGIVVAVIESIKCNNRADCPLYYRNVLAFGCGSVTIFGILCLLTLQFNRRPRLNRD